MRRRWVVWVLGFGVAFVLFGAWRGGGAVLAALGGDMPPYAAIGHAALVTAGLCLINAWRRLRSRRSFGLKFLIGWGMLSLGAISAAAIYVHTWIDPRIVIALVFSGAFALIGLFLALAGDAPLRRPLRSERQRRDAADEALTGDLDWRDGHLEEDAAKGPGRAWWPAILGVGFLWVIALISGELRPVLAVLAISAAFLGWLAWARWRRRLRLARYGTSRFTPPALPIRLTDGVAGRIEVPHPPTAPVVEARLRCVHRHYRSDRSRPFRSQRGGARIDVLFDETEQVPIRDGVAEIAFATPGNLPPSRDGGGAAVFWRLTVRAVGGPEARGSLKTPGYAASFLLPVRR